MKIGPDIIHDSLLFHLDASSYRSYPITGSHWLDISGNDNHFRIFGNPTWDTEGFRLDEVGDYFTSSLLIDNNNDNFTVEAWFQFHQTDTAYGPIITRWKTGAGTENEFFLSSYNGNSGPGYPNFGVDSTTGVETAATGTELMTTGTWYQQAGTFDGTTAKVYLNGELVTGSADFSGTPNTYRANLPIAIGAFGSLLDQTDAGTVIYEAALKIRSARMYNRALTSEEVLHNYNVSKHRYGY